MKRGPHLLAMLVAVFVLVAAGNLIAARGFGGARLDLTERSLYELSPGTVQTLRRLDEPVRWTFYYSRRLAADYPAIRAYGARVREMLRGYEAVSGGRIIFEEIDPEAFSEREDEALELGLQPAPVGEADRLFFGLVARDMIDETHVIPYFAPERESLLEYELTRILADLARADEPRLAILTSLPIETGRPGSRPSAAVVELESNYAVDWVQRAFVELPEADALLIVHPPDLSDDQLYAIDQFVMGGGRVIAAIDPMAHLALRAGPDGLPPPNARRSSGLAPLLAIWGAAFDPEQVAMDIDLALPVQVTEDGRTRVRGYPLWFSTGPQEMSDNDLATSGLTRGVNFGSPGFLEAVPGRSSRFEPLITTTANGARLPTETAARNPSPDEITADYPEPGERLTLAARLSGALATAYPDGPPAGSEIVHDPEAQLTETTAGDVVIIADADWLDDSFFLRSDAAFGTSVVADNLSLLVNLIDIALGDPALVGLRSRAPSARPMLRVEQLRADAERRFVEEQASLQDQIDTAQARIAELQNPSITDEASLTMEPVEIRAEMRALRSDVLTARNRLRDVERDFRSDIDDLEASLRFWALWFPPLAVLLTGFVLALLRRRGRA
ncbi:GldG family protein [Hyphobacterium marinum]|uniref:GldG family protein n=1 Tax=Hyphobacterium marinum TaxID=3116574 RepID=A0ABU7LVF5_9PROT|nr:GldG family protein [Hyphobacterium sp. Y6023]MEE2565549.1 GldG family protein [Hyphobacterium sp. Y6023]